MKVFTIFLSSMPLQDGLIGVTSWVGIWMSSFGLVEEGSLDTFYQTCHPKMDGLEVLPCLWAWRQMSALGLEWGGRLASNVGLAIFMGKVMLRIKDSSMPTSLRVFSSMVPQDGCMGIHPCSWSTWTTILENVACKHS